MARSRASVRLKPASVKSFTTVAVSAAMRRQLLMLASIFWMSEGSGFSCIGWFSIQINSLVVGCWLLLSGLAISFGMYWIDRRMMARGTRRARRIIRRVGRGLSGINDITF